MKRKFKIFLINSFDGIDVGSLKIENKLSPKILIVKPNVRLSWQYHNRRAEIWQVYKGIVGVVKSDTDIENELKKYTRVIKSNYDKVKGIV